MNKWTYISAIHPEKLKDIFACCTVCKKIKADRNEICLFIENI